MPTHVKTIFVDASQQYMVDLRDVFPAPTDKIYRKTGRLKISITGPTGAMLQTYPVVVGDNATPPTPAAFAMPPTGNVVDLYILDADKLPSIELGVSFSKGFSSEVYGPPLATHLAVAANTTVGGCLVRIAIDY